MKTYTIDNEDLARVQARQGRVKDALRNHNVRHPADLPVPEILALRALRLGEQGRRRRGVTRGAAGDD